MSVASSHIHPLLSLLHLVLALVVSVFPIRIYIRFLLLHFLRRFPIPVLLPFLGLLCFGYWLFVCVI